MNNDTQGQAIGREIAEANMEFVREHSSACADVSPVDYGYVRFRDGDWQRVASRKWGRLVGGTFDSPEEVRQAFERRAVNLIPSDSAFPQSGKSIWARAAEQDVFSDLMRCGWCGHSERTREIGECPYCADIYPGSEPHPDNAVRCNGCGNSRAESHTLTIPNEDEETILGTYCRGCLQILDDEDIEPGQHEQYTLMEGEA